MSAEEPPASTTMDVEKYADGVAAAIREKAFREAAGVAAAWEQTKADPEKSANPQMARVIAEVARVTASKIREGIAALIGKPEPPKLEPRWVERMCDCDWAPDNAPGGCPQGKIDGKCSIWVRG